MQLGVITDCFRSTHRAGIEAAAALGLQGVQLYATTGAFSPRTLTAEDKSAYRRLLAEKGLVVSALCGDMGGYGFERAAETPERVRCTKEIVDLAVEFDAPVVTTHIGVSRG